MCFRFLNEQLLLPPHPCFIPSSVSVSVIRIHIRIRVLSQPAFLCTLNTSNYFPVKLLINLLLSLALKSAQKFHFMKILWELNINYN